MSVQQEQDSHIGPLVMSPWVGDAPAGTRGHGRLRVPVFLGPPRKSSLPASADS